MKKIVLLLIAIIMCFTLTGCGAKPVDSNKSFGKYTGIYKLKNMELRIVHYKNELLVLLRKDGEPYGNTSVTLEGNKFSDLDCEFELKNDSIKVTTDKKDMPKGDYIRIKPYSTKKIYKDYIGDISYVDNNNGIYENNDIVVYTVRSREDTTRIAYAYKDMSANIDLRKENDTHFKTEIFGDIYDLKYNNDELEIKVESESDAKIINGTYKRKDKLTAVKAIQIFVFEDYRKDSIGQYE